MLKRERSERFYFLVNVESLRDELNSFAQNYSQLKRTLSTQSRLKVRMAKERAASQKE